MTSVPSVRDLIRSTAFIVTVDRLYMVRVIALAGCVEQIGSWRRQHRWLSTPHSFDRPGTLPFYEQYGFRQHVGLTGIFQVAPLSR